jgi:hypothetical protein
LNASRPRLFKLDGAATSGDGTSMSLSRSARWPHPVRVHRGAVALISR